MSVTTSAPVGYARLATLNSWPMPALGQPAYIGPVKAIQYLPERIQVPYSSAPAPDDLIGHLVFALRHETMNLPLLLAALADLNAERLAHEIRAKPTSQFLRQLGYFWEHTTQSALPVSDLDRGRYMDVFDVGRYYTGRLWEKNRRWRLNFNGLGPIDYCPVVRRDTTLEARTHAVLAALTSWVQHEPDLPQLNRVLNWAYLAETQSSFQIEREVAQPAKAEGFVQALQAMREQQPLTETYLTELQQTVVTSPLNQEFHFRTEQNWLQRAGRGALAVRYVPPPVADLRSLMGGFMAMVNAFADSNLPIFHQAALASFGFVYLHPFMDGNGRVSRLLAQHTLIPALTRHTGINTAAILPLSVAMVSHEARYLATLERFSTPMRALWDVHVMGDGEFQMQYRGHQASYASWDATEQSRFMVECAEYALNKSLIGESLYLRHYDDAFQAINTEFDWPDRAINLLIKWVVDGDFSLSKNRLKDQRLAGIPQQDIQLATRLIKDAFAPEAYP